MIYSFNYSLRHACLSSRLPAIHRIFKSCFGPRFRGFRTNHDRSLDRQGMDGTVLMANGELIPVDVKCPQNNPPSDLSQWTIPLETWGCKERGDRGYLLSGGKITRYVLWVYPDGNWLLLPFRSLAASLRRFRKDWTETYRVSRQRTDGYYETYHSECVLVPAKVVAAAVTDHVRQYRRSFHPRSSIRIE